MEIYQGFKRDLEALFPERIKDIVVFGSYITGDFTGRGDLDFIVFFENNLNEKDKDVLFQLHEGYRERKTDVRLLEGIYYGPNNGVYIGTSRKGWKAIEGCINGYVEQAMILQDHQLMNNAITLSDHFTYEWSGIIEEIEKNNEFFEKHEGDIEFDIYAIQTSARNLYTLRTGKFASKSQALKFVMENYMFSDYVSQLERIKLIRYPYTKDECSSLSDTRKLLNAMTLEVKDELERL